jgi:PAS domain S-box-containing protein
MALIATRAKGDPVELAPDRVLIVNDSPEQLEFTAALLRDAGYDVLMALDGYEGLAQARHQHPDVVISDVVMPRMDGFELCRAIRTSADLHTTPVLLVSGLATNSESAVAGLKAGADDYLELPYDPMRLVSKVARLIERKRAEEILRSQKEALLEAQRLARVGSWRWSIADGATEWSDELFRIAGREAGDGTPSWGEQNGMYASNRRALFEAIERTLATGEPYGVEVELIRPSGESRWIISRGEPFRNNRGEIAGLRGTAHDITERRREHELLRDSEQRFRLMTDTIQDVFWMRDASTGRMLYVSPAYETLWGRSIDSLAGDPLSALEAVHPDDRTRIEAVLPVEVGKAYEHEYRLVRDGSVRWIRDRGYPVRDEHGTVLFTVGAASDITEVREQRQQLERLNESLERSERRYRDLVENLNDVVYSLDPDGRLLYVSPAIVRYGYQPEQLMGRHFSVLVHADDVARIEAAVAGVSEGIIEGQEFRVVARDGAVHHVRTSSRSMFDGSRLAGVTGVVIDVTEQRRAEEQLRAAQRLEAVGRLAGGIAHDFNNLLVAINGYAEFALDAVPEGDPMRSDLAEILKAGNRAAALTRQLLAFSRKQVLQPEIIDLNEVVTGMDSMLRRLIGEDVEFETVLGGHLPQILADPGQIEQVIMNLVVNARDAMPTGGRLVVSTWNEGATTLAQPGSGSSGVASPSGHEGKERAAGEWVVVSVSDTGSGMDEQTKAQIFEPFFSTKPLGEGTGLGLSTVHGIVSQSGGTISVESARGAGTTFRVAFPQAAEARRPAVREVSVAPAKGRETILIVEDEPAVRELARRFLSAAGYTVLTAGTGVDAIRTCQSHGDAIDLLLTDVVMPQMSGTLLRERLGEIRPGLRVLYMSGYSGTAIAHHGVLEEGMHLIHKPFNSGELARKVREVLEDAPPRRS